MSTPSLYTDGTITVTDGSPAFTGSGTAWSTQLKRGTLIQVGADLMTVASIEGDGAGTFAANWPGAAAADAAYVAITWSDGGEIAEAIRTLMERLIGKGLGVVTTGVPVAADYQTNDLVWNGLALYIKTQGQMVAIAAGIGYTAVGPWVGDPVAKTALAIVTAQVAIDYSTGADAPDGSVHFALTVDEDAEVQAPTNVGVGDVFEVLFTIDGGPHALTFAAAYAAAIADLVRAADGDRTRLRFTVDAESGGTATALSAEIVAFAQSDLVDDGGFAYLSNLAANAAEPLVSGGQPLSDANWTALRIGLGIFALPVFAAGTLTAGELIARVEFVDTVTFPAGLSDSRFSAETAADAEAVWSLQRNDVEVGTVTFAAASATGVMAAPAEFTMAPGDILTVIAPSPADATLADVSGTLRGTR